MAPRLPDADQSDIRCLARRGISRFPRNEFPHMPGSSTTPGRPGTRAYAPFRIAFHLRNSVGTRDMNLCEAQWLAYVSPYRRFVAILTGDNARLGSDVGRYSVIMSDLHRPLVAGLPAHCERFCTSSRPARLRDFQRQNTLNPARCHRSIVSGRTMTRTCRIDGHQRQI
jgi:hypothetical protein